MQARGGAVRRDGFGDHAVGAARAPQSLPQDLPRAPEVPELLGYRSLRCTSWAPFPSLRSCWAGATPPRALARSVLEADAFFLSFPGVTACLAPCRGLLIPLPLLCSPAPAGSCPLLPQSHQMPPGATAAALFCSLRQCLVCPQHAVLQLQGSPGATLAPRAVTMAPGSAGDDSASNYPSMIWVCALAWWRREQLLYVLLKARDTSGKDHLLPRKPIPSCIPPCAIPIQGLLGSGCSQAGQVWKSAPPARAAQSFL